jgi:hypothetical protein
MGGVVRGSTARTWYFPQQLNETTIAWFGDRVLAGLSPGMRQWADQQAQILLRQGRFTSAQQGMLERSIRQLSVHPDPRTTENLEVAVLYLALRSSVHGSFSLVLNHPETMTPLQRDILGPYLTH